MKNTGKTAGDDGELIFPVMCHFRVIAEDGARVGPVIETTLVKLGVTDPVERGNRSAAGRYVSFNVSTMVESREKMNRIDRELRGIAGVRMIL